MSEDSQLNNESGAQDDTESTGQEESWKPDRIDPSSVPHIEEQARDAMAAAEPTGTKIGDKVEGAQQWGAASMTVKAMHTAGWVYVYDTLTHEQSKINRNWLAKQLAKKRPDGTFYFTTVKPKTPPRRGTIKCILHPEGPNRDHYDELGFPVCMKANLPNKHQQQLHMKNRHQAEWATIREEITDQKEAQKAHDDEQFRKTMVRIAEGNVKKK